MFKVKDENNKVFTVFDVTYDNNGHAQFLVYDKNRWIRCSAKMFKPYYAKR